MISNKQISEALDNCFLWLKDDKQRQTAVVTYVNEKQKASSLRRREIWKQLTLACALAGTLALLCLLWKAVH